MTKYCREYWLLKKQLGGWTKVSWWAEHEKDKAERSYHSMVAASGYAVRLVSVNIEQEHLLDEMLPEPQSEPEVVEAKPVKINPSNKSSWGNTHSWGSAPLVNDGPFNGVAKPEHGMSGKVWLGNPVTKEKKRVAPDEVAAMMEQGWVKAGPRTVL